MFKNRFALALVLILTLALGGVALAQDPTYTEVWDGRGTDSERCDLAGEPGRPDTGWIHWLFSTKGASDDASLALGGTGSGTYEPGEPLNAATWHFYTPYFDLDGLTATISLFGGLPGPGGGLVISDFCPSAVEQLDVSKTVVTSFTREHFWDIDKYVGTDNGYTLNGYPKIWLYIDGSGDETATWTVDVTYEGYVDSGFNVSGDITIANTGTLDAVITAVDDVLAGTAIDVDCGVTFPYTLPVDATLTCSYSEDGFVEGFNEVTVTTERDEYFADAEIVWGDPTNEINATVNVQDISDLFGTVDLGTVTAPNDAQFTYDKDFAWADYGRYNCGDFVYDNTATIVETGQSADATLKVNVQCYIVQGETAWAANGNVPLQLRYTPRGNWATYVAYAEKTTTLFAGQTIPVGTVSFSAVVDGNVTITVTLYDGWVFEDVSENLMVQGYSTAPSGNPAPGLFANKKYCDPDSATCEIVVPAANFYGVHVNVGQLVPDPNFGP
jgi:hypothetical protein